MQFVLLRHFNNFWEILDFREVNFLNFTAF